MAIAEGKRSLHCRSVGFCASKRTDRVANRGSTSSTFAAQFASPPRSAAVAVSTPGATWRHG